MIEIWRNIEGYEGLYQVSNLGRVKSLKFKDERILKCGNNGRGYLFVGLSKHNKVKHHYIHRLVAKAFIPNPDNLPEVNHRDEDKTNNNINNLEWCNHIYNMNYGTHNKRMCESLINNGLLKGKKHPRAKTIICITTGEIFDYMGDITKKYGVSNSNISACCKGRYKTAGKHPITGEKLVWMYYKEYLKLQEAV